ncbi:MAG: hypothetical protein GY871_11905 [Actinomycetales bacterium]|nr:hypothetical protein [Actinomycetales bacterium]
MGDNAWIKRATVVLDALASGQEPPRDEQRAAVKGALAELVASAPGKSVEVRIPPYAAVQVIEGATHRRGTPPAVVEMNTETWLALALGRLTWAEATRDGRVYASGARSDLSELLPLGTPRGI